MEKQLQLDSMGNPVREKKKGEAEKKSRRRRERKKERRRKKRMSWPCPGSREKGGTGSPLSSLWRHVGRRRLPPSFFFYPRCVVKNVGRGRGEKRCKKRSNESSPAHPFSPFGGFFSQKGGGGVRRRNPLPTFQDVLDATRVKKT